MNNQPMEPKISQDVVKVKKDVSTLVGDSAVQLGRFEANMTQATVKAKDDLTTWVGDSVAHLSAGIGKGASDAKEIVVETAATVDKDVRHGLSQYNAKAQKLADKVPGGIGQKAAQYPWIAVSLALVVGFMLAMVFRPARVPVAQIQI